MSCMLIAEVKPLPVDPAIAHPEDADSGHSKNKAVRSVEMQQKIANLKVWSVNTYKCSKQVTFKIRTFIVPFII